ncbi:MAG: hypothetical protein AAF211_34105, partial [Myxococcota bacterium]
TNTADRGGALYVTESISTLRHTQLHGNGARRTGGGLHATASTVYFTNGHVEGNQLTGGLGILTDGAGMYIDGANLTMFSDMSTCDPSLVAGGARDRFCSEVRDNTGTNEAGGILARGGSQVLLSRTSVAANEGGALKVETGAFVNAQNSLVFDHGLHAHAIAITVDASSALEMSFTTVANNRVGLRLARPSSGLPGAVTNLTSNIIDDPIQGRLAVGTQNLVMDVDSMAVPAANLQGPALFHPAHPSSRFKVKIGANADAPGAGVGVGLTDIDDVARPPADWTRGALQAVP